MTNWQPYHDVVGHAPNRLLTDVLNTHKVYPGTALDLGAGNLRDSCYLMAWGFKRVIAIDLEEPMVQKPRMLEFYKRDIAEYVPHHDIFNLVVSCNTLFFIPAEKVLELIKRVEQGLRKGGIFACNFLGEKDDWLTSKNGPRRYGLCTEMISELERTYNILTLKNRHGKMRDATGIERQGDLWRLVMCK